MKFPALIVYTSDAGKVERIIESQEEYDLVMAEITAPSSVILAYTVFEFYTRKIRTSIWVEPEDQSLSASSSAVVL